MDKVIYALRDVTGTVASIPLIATSIMSKKIAGGADKILLDVKVGDGALMKTYDDARELANLMTKIGTFYNREVICEITDMNTPLGDNIGNSLEVIEAMDILKGKKGHLRDLCVELASHMVSLGLNISYEEAKEKVLNNLDNGKAYDKFLELVKYQNGNIDELPQATNKYEIKSKTEGYLVDIDAYKLGILSMSLGAGRKNKEDTIDYSAGIIVNKNLNDYVNANDIIMTLYTNKEITNIDNSIFKISDKKTDDEQLIYEIIK
jgi:pyrimidine-nucleoside phosphorylase